MAEGVRMVGGRAKKKCIPLLQQQVDFKRAREGRKWGRNWNTCFFFDVANLDCSSKSFLYRVLSHYRKANILLSQTWKKMSFIHTLDSWYITFKLRTLTPLQTRKSYFFYMFNTCHLSINTKVGTLHTPSTFSSIFYWKMNW